MLMGLLSVCQYAICMLGAGNIRGQERALKVRRAEMWVLWKGSRDL